MHCLTCKHYLRKPISQQPDLMRFTPPAEFMARLKLRELLMPEVVSQVGWWMRVVAHPHMKPGMVAQVA